MSSYNGGIHYKLYKGNQVGHCGLTTTKNLAKHCGLKLAKEANFTIKVITLVSDPASTSAGQDVIYTVYIYIHIYIYIYTGMVCLHCSPARVCADVLSSGTCVC